MVVYRFGLMTLADYCDLIPLGGSLRQFNISLL